MKFLNKTDVVITVSTLSGHCAIFQPGEERTVPAVMKAACLAQHLSLTEGADEVVPETTEPAKKPVGRKGTTKKKAAAVEAQPEAGETVLDDAE